MVTQFQEAKLRELVSEMSLCHDDAMEAVRGRKSSLRIAKAEEAFYDAEREMLRYISFLFKG